MSNQIGNNEKILKISNNHRNLKYMLNDYSKASKLFRPADHWIKKSKRSSREIKKYGLSDFRSWSTLIGDSFADNSYVDITNMFRSSGLKGKLAMACINIPLIKRIFQLQVNLTKGYAKNLLKARRKYTEQNIRAIELINKYSIPNNTVNCGCQQYAIFNNKKISLLYLEALNTIDYIKESSNLNDSYSYLEIGGGFGVNIHLIQNIFPNIRKFIFIEIPPTLYVANQYLKSIFGDSVVDYEKNRTNKNIKFKNNSDLEILCIAPWQIDNLNVSNINHIHNANSFVEVPEEQLKFYSESIRKFLSKQNGSISLVSFEDVNSKLFHNSTILTKYFGDYNFDYSVKSKLIFEDNKYYYYFFNR